MGRSWHLKALLARQGSQPPPPPPQTQGLLWPGLFITQAKTLALTANQPMTLSWVNKMDHPFL